MLSDFDVTIIGLGPVGSFAALLMENRGLKVLAIDRDIDIYSLPRAVSISDQGLRMAQEIDLDQIYFKNSTEVIKRLPELPEIMDKANQALTYLASGQIPENSNSYTALNDKKSEMVAFRNQSIIGLLLLVIFGLIVF